MGKHTNISSRMGLKQGICTWFDSQPSFNRGTQYSIYEILSFNLKRNILFGGSEDNRREAYEVIIVIYGYRRKQDRVNSMSFSSY